MLPKTDCGSAKQKASKMPNVSRHNFLIFQKKPAIIFYKIIRLESNVTV